MREEVYIGRILVLLIICLSLSACGGDRISADTRRPLFEPIPEGTEEAGRAAPADASVNTESEQAQHGDPALGTDPVPEEGLADAEEEEPEPVEGNGRIVLLYTSDVHCGVDQNFGYEGLKAIREAVEDAGYSTILLDNGDAVQGERIGDESLGEAIIPIMNGLRYDVAVPGNHEFDYGIEQFRRLVRMADFPYVCCNLFFRGELLLKPFIIMNVRGIRIAVVGFTTPWSLDEESRTHFLDENGELPYDFCMDDSGRRACEAVQQAVDSARMQGADFVYLSAHAGNTEDAGIFSSEALIRSTTGIDVVIDGHSEDLEQFTVPNRDGTEILRSACGFKLNAVGYSVIDPVDGITKTGIWVYDGTPDLVEMIAELDA